MMVRAASIVIGMGVSLSLYNLAHFGWLLSCAIGAGAYLISRYIFWAVAENRRFKADMAQAIEKAQRGEPLDI